VGWIARRYGSVWVVWGSGAIVVTALDCRDDCWNGGYGKGWTTRANLLWLGTTTPGNWQTYNWRNGRGCPNGSIRLYS